MSEHPDPNIIHVYPLHDQRSHDTEHGHDCWCEPDIERQEGGGVLVVHECSVHPGPQGACK